MTDFHVGQKLWLVADHLLRRPTSESNLPGSEQTVTKIGRQYVYTKFDKIDRSTMQIVQANFGSVGRAFLSREDFIRERQIEDAWKYVLSRTLTNHPPRDVTMEQIAQIAVICGIQFPPPPKE